MAAGKTEVKKDEAPAEEPKAAVKPAVEVVEDMDEDDVLSMFSFGKGGATKSNG